MDRIMQWDTTVPHFMGYLRDNGDVGVRNHVVVITIEPEFIDFIRIIETTVKGIKSIAPSIPNSDPSNKHQIELMKKICLHPNVGGALWVGSPDLLERIKGDLETAHVTFCPLDTRNGYSLSHASLGSVIEKAAKLVQVTSRQKRRVLPINLLKLALECGGSDYSSGIIANPTVGRFVDRWIGWGGAAVFSETAEIIGTEEVLISRALNDTVGQQIKHLIDQFEEGLAEKGINVRQSNPSWENKNGGLTTIEEKALGAVAKGGSSPIVKVLKFAEALEEKGLHFMDTPSFGPESLTGMALGGCQVSLFTTGVGNPYGDLIMPTIKVTARESTGTKLKHQIDIDISKDADNAIDAIQLRLLSVVSGQLTKSEIWKDEGVCLPWFGM